MLIDDTLKTFLTQALAEFGHVAADDLNLNINVYADHFSKSIHVTKSDSLVMKLLDVSGFMNAFNIILTLKPLCSNYNIN